MSRVCYFLSRCQSHIATDVHVGIGVRLSIYLQVLLPIVPQVVAFVATPIRSVTKSTLEDVKAVTASSTSILATGLALLLSAVIQAKTIQLTAYHTTIILNLNWLVLWATQGTFGFVLMEFLDGPKDPGSDWFGENITGLLFSLSAHSSLMSIFGIVFWKTLNQFDKRTPECTAITVQSVVFRDYPLSSCKTAWLVVYSIFVIPIFNVFFLLILLLVLTLVPMKAIVALRDAYSLYIWPILFTIVSMIFKVFIITGTELTIAHNRVQAGENQWTLGQTLALLLVLPTLSKTRKDSKIAFKMWKAKGRMQQITEIEDQLKSSEVKDQLSALRALAELCKYGDHFCSSVALSIPELSQMTFSPLSMRRILSVHF